VRASWKIGEGSLELRYEERKIERVLVEHNGPQLGTLRDGDHRYLGVASDADNRHIRWIHAQIDNLEWASLVAGILPLRDVFQKPIIWIIDEYTDGEMRNRGQVASGVDLTEDDLPSAGAILPTAIRLALASEMTQEVRVARSIRLERRDRSKRMDLGAMALAVRKFHTLWLKCGLASTTERTATELTDIARRAQLLPVATFPGSFAIQIETTDAELFQVIAERVTHLVARSTDHEALVEFFSNYPGVRAPYDSFLKTMHDEGLDMLASWSREVPGEPDAVDGVFVGTDRAELARAAIRKTSAPPRELAFAARGYCRGVLKDGRRFEFYDTAAKMSYTGKVSKTLAQRLQGEAIVLSEDQLYDASISEKTAASSEDDAAPEYELVELKVAPP
jgi:hypothetical protein